ncbi:MAG: DUF2750 domain-containing protein [Bacteroidales bacterium]|nr:DUF2750 domain-containing protein [Bacteroidales bacterium]
MEQNLFERFIAKSVENDGVWLLQAMDGMFAMVESDDFRSYLAVWDNENDAATAAVAEWEGYTAIQMELKEWIHWLNEMIEDQAWIGIAPDVQGKIFPILAEELLRIHVETKKMNQRDFD